MLFSGAAHTQNISISFTSAGAPSIGTGSTSIWAKSSSPPLRLTRQVSDVERQSDYVSPFVSCAASGGPSGPAEGTNQYSDSAKDIQPPAGPDQGGPIQGSKKGGFRQHHRRGPPVERSDNPWRPSQGGPIQGTTKAPSGSTSSGVSIWLAWQGCLHSAHPSADVEVGAHTSLTAEACEQVWCHCMLSPVRSVYTQDCVVQALAFNAIVSSILPEMTWRGHTII